MRSMGLTILVAGTVLVVAGVIMMSAHRLPGWLGHLPGDLHWRGRNWGCSFPVVSCILVSAALTVVVNLVLRMLGK